MIAALTKVTNSIPISPVEPSVTLTSVDLTTSGLFRYLILYGKHTQRPIKKKKKKTKMHKYKV